MKALLLAAGLGTRLRPLTDHTPKCLVKIADRPLLDYWLADLHAAGVEEFLINTHYLPEQIRKFANLHPLRSKIRLVHEPVLLGTAGTLLANQDFFDDTPTILAHADNLCLCSWREFVAAHSTRPVDTLMTMMTFKTSEPSQCGIVELDSNGLVIRFHEKQKNPPGNLANAAVYMMDQDLVHLVLALGQDITDISTQVLPSLLGRINTWENRDVLIDIGSPDRLAKAQSILPRNSAF